MPTLHAKIYQKPFWCFIILFFFVFLCYHTNAFSGTGDSIYSDSLFAHSDPLKITMMADFKSLLKDRGEDRSYHKGMIYYLPNPSDTIYRKVKLKTRGNFRRDSANCKYPPIQVKFGKRDLDDYIFADQAKFKLVIQCQIEDYVLLEYLAYRIYNLLCKESYRVRLAEITYVDINTKVIYTTKYGFFIESNGELENRLNAEITRQHPPSILWTRTVLSPWHFFNT